jgi:hypothetical protein
MKTLAYNLRTLRSLTDCVHRDLETYLESPADYDAAEYFADVADAASEALRLVDEVLNHIARDTRFVNIWLDEENE